MTLRAWRQAWEERKEEVLALGYSERFWRKYRFYCEYGSAALLWHGLCHGSLSSACRFARLPVSAPLARPLQLTRTDAQKLRCLGTSLPLQSPTARPPSMQSELRWPAAVVFRHSFGHLAQQVALTACAC